MQTSPISPARPVAGAKDQGVAGASPKAAGSPAPAAQQPAVAIESMRAADTPPIDHERVQLIRKAIAEGTYPVVPAKIADAIIAAGLLLSVPK